MSERFIALLPMKEHSERVPNKNFRSLVKKPLYRWVLDELLAIPEIDIVVINTDADQLLSDRALLNHPRICIRERRQDLRGDFVSMNKILENDIEATAGDMFLMTHSTNPLLSRETIAGAIGKFLRCYQNGDCDSLFTVTRHHARLYHSDASPVNHDPSELLRTQDLPPLFEENSCLYIFSRRSFALTKGRVGQRPLLYETPKLEAVDIDTPEDWKIAEALLRAKLDSRA